MGRCMFASCNHDTKEKGVSFFRVPVKSAPDCAKMWLSRAKRADLSFSKLTENYWVCEAHFSKSQLEFFTYGGELRCRVKKGEVPYPNGTTPPKPRESGCQLVDILQKEIERRITSEIGAEVEISDTSSTLDEISAENSGMESTCACKCSKVVTQSVGCQTGSDLLQNVVSPPELNDHSYSVPVLYDSDYPLLTEADDRNLNSCFWRPDANDMEEDSTDSEGQEVAAGDELNSMEEIKWIVHNSALLTLFHDVCCRDCKMPTLRNVRGFRKGSCMVMQAKCKNCLLFYKWESQPRLGQKYAGNVALAASILLSGSTFTQFSKPLDILNIASISSSLFYAYQRSLLVPAIDSVYEQEMTVVQVLLDHEENTPLSLAGDGRFDSPGHSARYCTYTFMDMNTGLAVSSLTVECASSTSSTTSEKEAFIDLLAATKSSFSIKLVTTDGHLGIRKHMREQEKDIIHNQDVWHWTKNFSKKISESCRTKSQKELLPWVKQIKNHIWWSAQKCGGDSDLLVEMVRSMVYHTVNVHHDFDGHAVYHRCSHSPLDQDVERRVQWLEPGSPAHEVLRDTLNKPNILQTLRLLNHGTHTGALESLHSLILTYAPKRLDFDPPGYRARIKLAIIDHNRNSGRSTMKDSEGNTRMRLYYSKDSKSYRLRKIYEAKEYSFRQEIVNLIAEEACKPTPIAEGNRGTNIARVPKPDYNSARSKHKSRYV